MVKYNSVCMYVRTPYKMHDDVNNGGNIVLTDVPCYEKLLRKHVALNVGKQGHSLLILLGLRDAEIQMLHNDNPHNYTNAIHGGLLKFKDRGGTWDELIEAMQDAAIGLEYIEGLKGELNSIRC